MWVSAFFRQPQPACERASECMWLRGPRGTGAHRQADRHKNALCVQGRQADRPAVAVRPHRPSAEVLYVVSIPSSPLSRQTRRVPQCGCSSSSRPRVNRFWQQPWQTVGAGEFIPIACCVWKRCGRIMWITRRATKDVGAFLTHGTSWLQAGVFYRHSPSFAVNTIQMIHNYNSQVLPSDKTPSFSQIVGLLQMFFIECGHWRDLAFSIAPAYSIVIVIFEWLFILWFMAFFRLLLFYCIPCVAVLLVISRIYI